MVLSDYIIHQGSAKSYETGCRPFLMCPEGCRESFVHNFRQVVPETAALVINSGRMVRWRPAADGVCDLRPDAVPLTAAGAMTPVRPTHARRIALDENAPHREKSQRSPPLPQRDFGNDTTHTAAPPCAASRWHRPKI